MDDQAPLPRRSSAPWMILAVLLVLGSAVGALMFYRAQSRARRGFIDASGFDLDQAQAPAPPGARTAASAAQPQSSLGMITGAVPGMQFGAKAGAQTSPQQTAAQNFTKSCRGSESAVRAMAENYTRRYPVIQQYGRDWMSYPDLKQLNDDYFRYHDPVRFLKGLAASPNFPILVRKYATAPEIQAFAKDVVTHAPGDLMSAGLDLTGQDGTLKQLAQTLLSALGLPPGLLSVSSQGKVDQNAVMGSLLNNNPELQKALNSNPELQNQIKSGQGN